MRISHVYRVAFLLLPSMSACGREGGGGEEGKDFTCYQYCKAEGTGQFVEIGQETITAADLDEANQSCVETFQCTAGTTGNEDRFCSCSEEQGGVARASTSAD